jgi:hypothetical protein
MGRLLAFILGGVAIALYAPYLVLDAATLERYVAWWNETIDPVWYQKIFTYGPGVFAGLALILLAVRGKD